jgi:release factor glutamine methyltransferase
MRDERDEYGAGPSAQAPIRARDLLKEASRQIDRLDAELLLAHHLKLRRWELLRDLDRLVEQPIRFALLVARRLRHEPLAYITGEREFWSLPLLVNRATLIPRPDSETLISEALAAFPRDPPQRILDIGTGSGALLLAALSEWPDARGVGLDISFDALAVAMANAMRLQMDHRVELQTSNWVEKAEGRFDLILCNPPYVEDGAELMPDVADYEPAGALFGGPDGLDCYRLLLPEVPRLLAPGGVALFEFGLGQGPALMEMAAGKGMAASLADDLTGRPRVLRIQAG